MESEKYNILNILFMNLQFPLSETYQAYSHIEIHKLKDRHKFIVIGYNASQNQYAGLIIKKIKSNEPLQNLSEIMEEVGSFPTLEELKEEMKMCIGEYQTKEIIFGEGILGFHRFMQGYYLHYIVEKESIAKIGRHKINEIVKTGVLSLFQSRTENKDAESKYREILDEYKVQNFYYSVSYDMTYSLAKNMVERAKPFYENISEGIKADPPATTSFYSDSPNIYGICEIFHFNYEIVNELSQAVKNKKWILSVVHGYCKHISTFTLKQMLISKEQRCRHHAGTRYIKRGINSDGFVANYIEVEQIVVNYSLSQDTGPVCSSFIQMRGSVPTYWMQRPSIHIPKPNIEVRNEDYLFSATRKHFYDMIGRYGHAIYAINLMKMKEKTPRESGLSKEYREGVEFINKNDMDENHSIHYIEIDMKYNLKLNKNIFVNKIRTFAYYTIQQTGIFLCYGIDRNSNDQYVEFQNGVIRANCVDCLDRTNSFQQLVGETVLSVQLSRLLKEEAKFESLELDEKILEMYSELYERMGDLISIQYGSSYAHKQKIQKTTESRNQFWTSIKRHFNNNLKDYDRQEQIDVFLGYRPDKEGPQLWETKPSIEHFPSKRVKQFQDKENYFESAYAYFKNEFSFELLNKSDNKAKWKATLFNKKEEFGKEELKTNLTPEIVESLVNDKEIIEKYRFCLTPKLVIEKRVWTEMNPKPKTIETLQQKLAYPYNKMDFLKSEGKIEKIMPLTAKNFKDEEERPQELNSPLGIKKSKNLSQLKPQHFLFDYDDEIKDLVNDYLAEKKWDEFDDEELKLMEQYIQGEIIKDEEIQAELQACQERILLENEIHEDIENRIRLMAEEEIKLIELNYSNGNYLGMKKKHKKDKMQPMSKMGEEKIDIIKNNKVIMLERIMQQNFTHGRIKGHVTEL